MIDWGHQPSITSGVPIGTAAVGNCCPYCSTVERIIYHAGVCPQIKSVEYYPDGRIKKIELHELKGPKPWRK